MAVRLLQVLIRQSQRDSGERIPQSQSVEMLRRLYWLFVEYDHHHSVMWNLPLQMSCDQVFGTPLFQDISPQPPAIYRPAKSPTFDQEFNQISNILSPEIPRMPTPPNHDINPPYLDMSMVFTQHHYHVQLLQILPLVSKFLMSSREPSERTRVDLMLTHWYESLPAWMQTANPVPLLLYFDARILLHKAQQDDTVYTGLSGTEPHFSKLVCCHSAISISHLAPAPDLFRPYVTAALVIMSGFQQGVIEGSPEYFRDRVMECINSLETLGHSVMIAKWDALKLKGGIEKILTIFLAMESAFGNHNGQQI